MSDLSGFSLVVFGELQLFFIILLSCYMIGTINYNKREKGRISSKIYIVYVAYALSAFFDFFSRAYVSYGSQFRIASSIFYTVMFIFNRIGPLFWFYFAEEQNQTHIGRSLHTKILTSIPADIIIVLIISSPFTGLLFTFGADGRYERGAFFALGTLVDVIYLTTASAHALFRAGNAVTGEEKKINYAFALYAVPILITVLLQYVTTYSFKGGGAAIAISAAYVFIVSGLSKDHMFLISALTEDFQGVFLVDVDKDYIRNIRVMPVYKKTYVRSDNTSSYKGRILDGIKKNVAVADRDRIEREFDAEHVYKMLETRQSFFITYRIISRDGIELYARAKFVRVDKGEGRFFILGIRNADTEIRAEMKEAAEDQARDDLIKILADEYLGIYLYDVEKGSCTLKAYTSRTTDEIKERYVDNEAFQVTYKEFVKKDVHPDDISLLESALEKETLEKYLGHRKRYSIVFRRKHGEEYRYEELMLAKAEGIDDPPENVAFGFVEIDEGYKEKIEQAKKLSDALEQADAASNAKSTFLFNMSHDIRTPMNAIMGFTDLAAKHIDEKEKVAEYLEKIDISGRHLLNLINDILDMSRVEAGKIQGEIKPVNIHEAADAVVMMCKEAADQKGVLFELIKKDIRNSVIYADELHINQIMMNIVSNAIKYTEAGGKVTFTLRELKNPEKGYAKYSFTVEDSGIGMSEEFLSHIYESFAREKSSTLSGIQGTGLGMAIVKRLVDYMGGTIDIDTKLGEGTKVTVILSFRLQKKRIKSDTTTKRKLPSLEGKKVLVVEDNELNREIIDAILQEEKMEVSEAGNGKLAYEMVKERGTDYYDYILMDIQMPIMDGYLSTGKIRALEGGKDIPIIALSANAFDEDKQKSILAGMNDHIAKPINVRELLSTMRKYMRE